MSSEGSILRQGTIAGTTRCDRTSGLVVTTVTGMPLGRYFVFIGSLLLVLLFLADCYVPEPAATPARADVDRTVIRLHSLHKLPERIVIDTSLPTIVPPAATIAAAVSPPKARSPRDAFALATPEAPPTEAAPSTTAQKPVRKRRTRTMRPTAEPVASYEVSGFHETVPAGW